MSLKNWLTKIENKNQEEGETTSYTGTRGSDEIEKNSKSR
jgi:hypothetical protein